MRSARYWFHSGIKKYFLRSHAPALECIRYIYKPGMGSHGEPWEPGKNQNAVADTQAQPRYMDCLRVIYLSYLPWE